MNRSSCNCGTVAAVPIILVLACFALSPQAQAVCQDGCLTNNNTVLGDDALISLTTGIDNTAIGFNALASTTEGNFNTAVGSSALASNGGIGSANVAVGWQALFSNQTGGANVAIGYLALYSNISGRDNVAIGDNALYRNHGTDNVGIGHLALWLNKSGSNNTAIGLQALFRNTSGSHNCAYGEFALALNDTASSNTAVGDHALFNNIGTNNIAIGAYAGYNILNGNDNISIGDFGSSHDSGTIRIGLRRSTNTFIGGISNNTVPDGASVVIDSKGRLGVLSSSARFKDAIKPMDKVSEAILALQPVTFHYKKEVDPNGISQFGLVAEEVEKVNPDLVARDDEGNPYTVRYEAVNAMLLNEFLKEHRRVEEQGKTIAELRSTIAQQQKAVETLSARLGEQETRITKISAQLAAGEAAPRVVDNR